MTSNKTFISSRYLVQWNDRKFDECLGTKQRNFKGYFGDEKEHLIRAQHAAAEGCDDLSLINNCTLSFFHIFCMLEIVIIQVWAELGLKN